jgi:hypothetical protein
MVNEHLMRSQPSIRHNATTVSLLLLLTIAFSSCAEQPAPESPYLNSHIFNNQPVDQETLQSHTYKDSVYVPIYSDIYSRTQEVRFLLTATLSIRNTSFTDTMIVHTVDYYDSAGKRVKEYLDHPIYVNPMASIDYVIEERDKTGGSGANFIVIWSGRSAQVKPVIEAVMISTNGQQGISFTTEGVSISKKEKHLENE